jgi:aromatic-L-amino-acid decarboxylase
LPLTVPAKDGRPREERDTPRGSAPRATVRDLERVTTIDPRTDPLDAEAPATGDLPFAALEHGVTEILARLRPLWEAPETLAVRSRVAPGEIRAALPSFAPASAESLAAILADLDRIVLPGITHWNHPGFFAYFSISSTIPSILAELLMAGLDTNGMLWLTSPAATELEQVVTRWLWQAMGLPDADTWFGMLTDTASISTLLALAAAREATGLDVRGEGLAGRDLPRLRVYCSTQAHSSVDKACLTLGLGHANVVKIACDAEFRLRPEALAAAIVADRAAGHRPMAIVATVGTTSTSSIDPVSAIADIAEREGCWLHVDAAYAGVAAIAPELRHVLDGVDRADSLVTNPHKWLFTTVDCSALFTRHPAQLKRAFSLVADYLVTGADDAVINYMDYGVQLGRRFRALKLWMVMRAFGTDGLAARIREHCALARELADVVRATPDWHVVAPVPFSLVCFRWQPAGMSDADADRENMARMERANATGEVFLSHTKLDGRVVLRLAIGNARTTREHVMRAWALLGG